MRKYYSKFLSILILSGALFLHACKAKHERVVHRSFYYWKSVFKLSAVESEALQNLKIENLYVKFFDVIWNDISLKPQPVAQINFAQQPPPSIHITPVIFITNETFQKLLSEQTDSLAANIIKLLSGITKKEKLNLSEEIQIDCDWTPGTKEKYFQLLRTFKQNDYFRNKIMSATIRLHQLKFTNENGIPPVDKGLLMCYNMGNLRLPETNNSIIDPSELKKYIQRLVLYPLPLDAAFPVFDWWVWFRGKDYKGLIHADELTRVPLEKKIVIQHDSLVNGFNFEKGDWLRYENSPSSSVLEVEKFLKPKINRNEMNVLLYSLDEKNLSKYKTDELESFFDGLR